MSHIFDVHIFKNFMFSLISFPRWHTYSYSPRKNTLMVIFYSYNNCHHKNSFIIGTNISNKSKYHFLHSIESHGPSLICKPHIICLSLWYYIYSFSILKIIKFNIFYSKNYKNLFKNQNYFNTILNNNISLNYFCTQQCYTITLFKTI